MREHADKKPRRWDVWIGLTLVAGVLAIDGQTLAFEFVGFVDDLFVFQNPIVKQGLSWEGLALAFSRSNVWVVTGEPPTRSPGSPTCSTSSCSVSWPGGTTP